MSKAHGDFVKLCTLEGKVIANWIPTDQNQSDLMTKALPTKAHEFFRKGIMNCD